MRFVDSIRHSLTIPRALSQDLLRKLFQNLRLGTAAEGCIPPPPESPYYPSPEPVLKTEFISHLMDSAELLCLSHQFELQAEADEAILSISREALVATPQTLKTVFLRFLVVLAEALRDKYQDPAMLLSVRSLYQTTLSSYVSKCTPKRPRKPTLNRKAFGCGFCAPCRSLDAFTTSSTVTWDYKPGLGMRILSLISRTRSNSENSKPLFSQLVALEG